MKVQPGVKIAMGFAGVAFLVYVAWPAYMNYQVSKIVAPPIAPDHISMVGVEKGRTKIIVANNVAQVVEASENFGGQESEGAGATEGSVQRRLPVQDLLKAIAGDGAALGRVAMKMNDVRQDEKWPTEAVIWTKERLEKALGGDAGERAKLEKDLNMTLDGKPLTTLSTRSAANGIIIETPVTIDGIVNGKATKVTGPYQEPFKPRLFDQLEKKLEGRAYTEQDMANEYGALAKPILSGETKGEDIAQTLRGRIDSSVTRSRMQPVEQLLRSCTVVVNSSMITGAEYQKREVNGETVYDLAIRLNDDGRRRLWKYSHTHRHNQILFISDGTAIAAPFINGDLKEGELVINQLKDEGLVKDAVAMIAGGSR